MLKYQIAEIENAAIEEGEEESLLALSKRIKSSENIMELISETVSALDGTDDVEGALEGLSIAVKNAGLLSEYFPGFDGLSEKFQEMYYEFEEFLHGPISDINGMLAGIYMLPHRNDPDYERMLKVARVHAEESDAVCIVGVCGEEGEDILGLKTGKAWYTEPLAHILVCQLIGSNLPERMNVGERSKNIFERIDRMVDVKYGHKA